jgi:hypothetical protein
MNQTARPTSATLAVVGVDLGEDEWPALERVRYEVRALEL